MDLHEKQVRISKKYVDPYIIKAHIPRLRLYEQVLLSDSIRFFTFLEIGGMKWNTSHYIYQQL